MTTSAYPSTSDMPGGEEQARFPVETEIYILPGGRVVVADMPAELADRLAALSDRNRTASPQADDQSLRP